MCPPQWPCSSMSSAICRMRGLRPQQPSSTCESSAVGTWSVAAVAVAAMWRHQLFRLSTELQGQRSVSDPARTKALARGPHMRARSQCRASDEQRAAVLMAWTIPGPPESEKMSECCSQGVSSELEIACASMSAHADHIHPSAYSPPDLYLQACRPTLHGVVVPNQFSPISTQVSAAAAAATAAAATAAAAAAKQVS